MYGEWHGGSGGSPHTCEFNPGDEIFLVQVNTLKIIAKYCNKTNEINVNAPRGERTGRRGMFPAA